MFGGELSGKRKGEYACDVRYNLEVAQFLKESV